ncbi:hypothetical protein [Polyangium sp. 15x6]|uniref:hypothetical protein n=1 Tax=Polyangium sp. 15x6 TaxID=3042687 RepID=UPI00249C7667|nr:hypothetical protein [Polyangium sp. 15x6]MDI3290296.1 hypothetical protein [Polyangium sp. 15x6]
MPSNDELVEKAKALAFDAVRAGLNQDYAYTLNATAKEDGWEVLILPQGRVRGGGARVHVQKNPMTVTKIVYLQ